MIFIGPLYFMTLMPTANLMIIGND